MNELNERINASTQPSSFVFAPQMNMRVCSLEAWYQTMKIFRQYDLNNYPFYIIFLTGILTVFGYFTIKAVDTDYASKQLMGASAGLILILFLSFIDYRQIIRLAVPLYLINLVLLILVNIPGIGIEVNNARRWLQIGIRIQPSEISKIILIIFTSAYIEKHRDHLNSFFTLLKLGIYTTIPLLLVLSQPNLSTAIITFSVVCGILILGGLSIKIISYVLAVSVPVAIFGIWYIQQPFQILLEDYQVQRILGFLNPEKYSQTYYQQENSLVAIGSGQLFGKLQSDAITSVSEAGFLPESHTDFIFAIVGQEYGFMGSGLLILLLLLIVGLCFYIGSKAPTFAGTLLCCGVGCLIAIQSFLNIGVATALLPNTGVPLPFVSYGLTSLFSMSMAIGMIMNVALQRNRYS